MDGADPWDLARFWAAASKQARLLGETPVEWYAGW